MGRKVRGWRAWLTTPMGFEYFVNVKAPTKKAAARKAVRKAPKGSEFRFISEIPAHLMRDYFPKKNPNDKKKCPLW